MSLIDKMDNLVQNLEVFENEEFGQVRATSINGEPWFVGKDIAQVLGYVNASKAVSTHCKHIRKEMIAHSQNGKMVKTQTSLINEGDLYRLIISSKLPNAEKFESWVFDEVLPTIRKTGGYIPHNENMTDEEIMARALVVAQKTIEEKSKLLSQAQETIEKQADAIIEMQPAVVVKETLEASTTSILIGELAKILKQNGIDIGQNRLFEWMRNNGYLIRRKGTDYNMPTQKSMDLGLFEIKETNIVHSDGTVKTSKTPKVTGKGQVYFINKFIKPVETKKDERSESL